MQYAGHMPHTPPQVALFGVVALLAGAGGALGIAAAVDDGTTAPPEIEVVVAEPQSATQSGHDEAATAAAVGTQPVALGGPNETATAAAVSSVSGSVAVGGPNEATTASAIGD